MDINYLIDVPPPTISGSLHIGHIFSYTQGDIIANYQKYLMKKLVYPFCFDNNGIPTSKLAMNKGFRTTKEIINFSVEKSREYLNIFNKSGIKFEQQSYNTYDNNAIIIAYAAFELLKNKGIIYKADTEYLWSEKLQTSISQSEIDENNIIEKTGEKAIIKKGIGWFINIKDHLHQIQEMINKINWKPFSFKKRIDNWVADIKWDWSISRERSFGIPIPNEENMTFDTWFISALSPQLAWASYTNNPSLICPIFDMRYQSHDIIRTWAFYTIAMSYFINNQIPWKTIMITGHTLDKREQKISKSIGNTIPFAHLLDKYGINGIRHWASSNSLGIDTQIDEEKMKMGWKITNKFKNAKKFIDMQNANNYIGQDLSLLDTWANYKLSILNAFDSFDIQAANNIIYKFFWNIFCDKWIEESKKDSKSITLKQILDEFEPIFNIIYKT